MDYADITTGLGYIFAAWLSGYLGGLFVLAVKKVLDGL